MKLSGDFIFCAALLMAMPVMAQENAALPVELVVAEARPVMRDIQVYGTIEAIDDIELGFRQAGRVTEVLVTEGDRVKTGEVLARLDSVQLSQSLNVAEATLSAARAAEKQTQQASDRAEAMLSRGVGTQAARDEALQALSEAKGMVERAESSVDQARRAVDETVLRAPGDVIVTARNVAPGQVVGAAQPVLSLASLDGLEAVFTVAADPGLSRVMAHDVIVTTTEGGHPEMHAVVTEIAPLVDPETGAVTAKARIKDAPAGIALLGAAVQGRLKVSGDPQIALPWTALMSMGATPAVWTVDADGRALLVPVQVSSFSDEIVYLADGILPGQTVIGAGSQLAFPGRLVRPAEVSR